jgi:adenine-specific DNA-methyltransferase
MKQSQGQVKDFARDLRQQASDVEQALWQRLRNRQILNAKFRRQHPIPPYVVDFVCLDKKLIIEADGGQHAERQTYDERRTAFLEEQGFRVLRFWNNEVLIETETVLEVIFRALKESPHPSPLPKGERE